MEREVWTFIYWWTRPQKDDVFKHFSKNLHGVAIVSADDDTQVRKLWVILERTEQLWRKYILQISTLYISIKRLAGIERLTSELECSHKMTLVPCSTTISNHQHC
jgi:hypothetical protein